MKRGPAHRRPRGRRLRGGCRRANSAARANGHPAVAAGDLPRRDRLRRGRRRRHRRARQPRQGPGPGGLRGLRGRQAAEGRVLLAGRHPGRAPRSLHDRGPAGRPRRADQRQAVRGPHLRAAARRLPRRRDPQRPGQAGRARLHRQVPRRQRRRRGHPLQRPPRRVAGVHQRSAPAEQRHRQVHRAEAALAHARAARRVQPHQRPAPDARHRRRQRHGRRPEDPRPPRLPARLLRPQHAVVAAQHRRVHGVDPRPPQGDPDVQRGHRLPDHGRLRLEGRLDGAVTRRARRSRPRPRPT